MPLISKPSGPSACLMSPGAGLLTTRLMPPLGPPFENFIQMPALKQVLWVSRQRLAAVILQEQFGRLFSYDAHIEVKAKMA